MGYHGWELVLLCFVRLCEIAAWPAVAITALWTFKGQIKKGLESFMTQLGQIIELKVAGVLMKFKGPEKVKLPPLDLK
jgi:hypothetical protein